MLLDLETTFGDDQDISQSTGTTFAFSNVYDLTASPLPIGPGEPVKVNIKIITAVTTGTTSEVQFQLVSTDTAPAGTPPVFGGTVEVVKETPAFDSGVLVAGWQTTLTAPLEDFTYRYMGVQFAITTAATTGGTAYAGIVCHEQTNDADWTAVTGF